MSSSPPKASYTAAVKQLSSPHSLPASQHGCSRDTVRGGHSHIGETPSPAPPSHPELPMGDVSLNIPASPIVGEDAPPCAQNLPCPVPSPDVINAPIVDGSKIAEFKSTCLLGRVWGGVHPQRGCHFPLEK